MKDQIKDHIKKYKLVYSCTATSVVVAGITALVIRGVASRHISVTIGDAASGTIGAAGKNVVMSNVSIISSNRKGSPSWVVRCKETGNIFVSQKKAALAMHIPQDHLSNHLNGTRDHANNYHFERICMAA